MGTVEIDRCFTQDLNLRLTDPAERLPLCVCYVDKSLYSFTFLYKRFFPFDQNVV